MGEISRGIAKTGEWKDIIMYQAISACNCCDMSIILEVQEDIDLVELSFHKEMGIYTFGETWFSDKWNRIKRAFELLFTSRTEMEGSFYFENEKQVDDFVLALQDGIRILKNNLLSKEVSDYNGVCDECKK